jgi:hypothetical protein
VDLAVIFDPNPLRNQTPGLRRQCDPVSFLLNGCILGSLTGGIGCAAAQQAGHKRADTYAENRSSFHKRTVA